MPPQYFPVSSIGNKRQMKHSIEAPQINSQFYVSAPIGPGAIVLQNKYLYRF
jgi:hypothetical protein